MRVEVRSHNIDHPRAVCAHAEHRFGLAVRRFRERLQAAQIYISDLNGPRGGVDKRCLIQLQGRSLNLVIEGIGDNPYAAIDSAIHRLVRSLRRSMQKERTLDIAGPRMVERLAS